MSISRPETGLAAIVAGAGGEGEHTEDSLHPSVFLCIFKSFLQLKNFTKPTTGLQEPLPAPHPFETHHLGPPSGDWATMGYPLVSSSGSLNRLNEGKRSDRTSFPLPLLFQLYQAAITTHSDKPKYSLFFSIWKTK